MTVTPEIFSEKILKEIRIYFNILLNKHKTLAKSNTIQVNQKKTMTNMSNSHSQAPSFQKSQRLRMRMLQQQLVVFIIYLRK